MRALKLLEASNCKYKVITADGDEYGELVVMTKKSKAGKPSKGLGLPRGEAKSTIKPYLQNLQVAQSVIIPRPEGWELHHVQSTALNIAAEIWGPRFGYYDF